MYSHRKTDCNAGAKLGAVQEVHRLAALVLGDPHHTSVLLSVCGRVPCGEYELFCVFVQMSELPKRIGGCMIFFQCVKSHELHHESYDIWMGFKGTENFLIFCFSVSGVESFIEIINFCLCFQ